MATTTETQTHDATLSSQQKLPPIVPISHQISYWLDVLQNRLWNPSMHPPVPEREPLPENSTPQTFPLFPHLPTELQLKIWSFYILQTPRLVSLTRILSTFPSPNLFIPVPSGLIDGNPSPPFSLLSQVLPSLTMDKFGFIKIPLRSLQSRVVNFVFCPEADILYFPAPEDFPRDLWLEEVGRDKIVREKVRCLMLRYTNDLPEENSWDNENGDEILNKFEEFLKGMKLGRWKNLEVVFVVFGKEDLRWGRGEKNGDFRWLDGWRREDGRMGLESFLAREGVVISTVGYEEKLKRWWKGDGANVPDIVLLGDRTRFSRG